MFSERTVISADAVSIKKHILKSEIRRQKSIYTKKDPLNAAKTTYDAREICKMITEKYNSQVSEKYETMKSKARIST